MTSSDADSTALLPRISVVVPALDEQQTIGACLRSLATQDYRGPVEVIVVDNASTDATAEIARSHGVRVLHEGRPGVCHARQLGTAAATGDIVVSTDADTTFPPTWLSQIEATMTGRPELVATCGPCSFVDAPWWANPYVRVLFTFVRLVYRLTGRVVYASATNIAFRRAAWSGYDTWMTQGGDELGLLRRLREKGPLHFDPARSSITSARRLRRGLLYNLFVTCLYYYFAAYHLNRWAGRPILGMAPAIRSDNAGADGISRTRALAVTVVAAVALTWWLSPVDVV